MCKCHWLCDGDRDRPSRSRQITLDHLQEVNADVAVSLADAVGAVLGLSNVGGGVELAGVKSVDELSTTHCIQSHAPKPNRA
jgi:hypothetical protein